MTNATKKQTVESTLADIKAAEAKGASDRILNKLWKIHFQVLDASRAAYAAAYAADCAK
jgi:hypothetical protein